MKISALIALYKMYRKYKDYDAVIVEMHGEHIIKDGWSFWPNNPELRKTQDVLQKTYLTIPLRILK